jgi:hypothetical protein
MLGCLGVVPHAAVKAHLAFDQIALVPFQPITSRYNINLRRGSLSAAGDAVHLPSA